MAQLKGESCDDYIEKILRQAIRLAMLNEQALHAIINGLQHSIKMYLLRQNVTTLEELRKAVKLAEDIEMQFMSTDTEITATLFRMERQLQVLATAQTSTTAAFNNVQSAPSITLVNRHLLVELRSLTTIARRIMQQATYSRRSSASTQTSMDVTVTPNAPSSTPEWTERWLPSTHRAQRDDVLQPIEHTWTTYYNPSSTTGRRTTTHRAQRDDVLQPDLSNYNMSTMLRYARFQNLSF